MYPSLGQLQQHHHNPRTYTTRLKDQETNTQKYIQHDVISWEPAIVVRRKKTKQNIEGGSGQTARFKNLFLKGSKNN